MHIIIFKKAACNVCEKFERSIYDRIKRDGEGVKVTTEVIYTDEPDGLVTFSDSDLGHIPAAIFKDDNGEELERWDGRADWQSLSKLLETLKT